MAVEMIMLEWMIKWTGIHEDQKLMYLGKVREALIKWTRILENIIPETNVLGEKLE